MFDIPVVKYDDIDYSNIIYDKEKNILKYKYNAGTSNEIIDDMYVLFDYEYVYLRYIDKKIYVYFTNNNYNDFFDEFLNIIDNESNESNESNVSNLFNQSQTISNKKICIMRSKLFKSTKQSVFTLHPSKKSGLEMLTSNQFDLIKNNIDKYFHNSIYSKQNNFIQAKLLIKVNTRLHMDNIIDHYNEEIIREYQYNYIIFNILQCDFKYSASYVNSDISKNVIYKENKITQISI